MKKQKKAGYFELNVQLKKLSLLLVLLMSFSSLAQVEELKKKYPKQKGKERIQSIIDISYALHKDNVSESKRYGILAEKEAKAFGDSTLLATVWNDWSFVYLYSGNLDSAILLNKQALHYRTLLKDTMGMAKSLNKIAMGYHEKGEYSKSLTANFESLKYFKQLKFEVVYGQVYNNIAAIYEATKNYKGALFYYSKAIENAQQFEDVLPEIRARINKGKCLKNLRRFAEAKEEYLGVLPKVIEFEDAEILGNFYMNLGVLEREMKNGNKAIEYYQLSLSYFREIEMISAIPLVLVNLSNSYLDAGQTTSAEEYLVEALALAKKSGSLFTQREVYQMYTRLEVIKGDVSKADEYLNKYMLFSDSITNEQNMNALAEMQVKFDSEENKLALAEEKIKTKNATIWLLISGVSIVLLVVIVWYIAQKKRIAAKNAELLNLRNLERERIRIARDLHDNLGAELMMITSKIDAKSFKSTNEAEKLELDELGVISRNANLVLRETIWSIHKETVTIEELVAKAKEYCNRIFSDSTIEHKVEGSDFELEISPANALHLFRIIQESANNAFKYADCKTVKVKISGNNVSITDDGKGFDFETVKKGYGLHNIEVRANEMNAQLTIQTSIGKGTSITVHFK